MSFPVAGDDSANFQALGEGVKVFGREVISSVRKLHGP